MADGQSILLVEQRLLGIQHPGVVHPALVVLDQGEFGGPFGGIGSIGK